MARERGEERVVAPPGPRPGPRPGPSSQVNEYERPAPPGLRGKRASGQIGAALADTQQGSVII